MTIRELLSSNWLPRPQQPKNPVWTGAAPVPVDYRDRISVVTWLFVFDIGFQYIG